MKLLLFCIFSVSLGYGQIYTTGLKIQYDMVTTGNGGTTMTDLSGNGNNGTLSGTTQGATGTSFNGTSDYISIPVIAGNGNYTIFVCGVHIGGGLGEVWNENEGAGMSVNFFSFGGQNRTSIQGTSTTSWLGGYSSGDFHCYYGKRDQNMALFGVVDTGTLLTANVGSTSLTSQTKGGIGAQVLTASQNAFWDGTLTYFMEYNVPLTPAQIAQDYAAVRTTLISRGVYMPDIAIRANPASVWNRQGVVIPNSVIATSNVQILYTTTDCQLISNPCFQAWANSAANNVWYSESPDGMSWQAPSTVISGAIQVGAVKVGSTYHVYATNLTSTQINHYTGTLPNSLTLANSAVIGLGTSGNFDSTHVYNPCLLFLNGTYYMLYSAAGNATSQGGSFICGGATSSDGVSWTKTGPITTVSDGPCNQSRFANINGEWYAWVNNSGSAFYRYQSATFATIWQGSSPTSGPAGLASLPTFYANAPDENVQMADPDVLQVGNICYMFYEGVGTGGQLSLKLATANMPCSQVVLTGEGMSSDVP